jgi:hypothetical protein
MRDFITGEGNVDETKPDKRSGMQSIITSIFEHVCVEHRKNNEDTKKHNL